MLSALLMNLSSKLSPNKNFSFWTILVLSCLNGIWTIYNFWALPIDFGGKEIFAGIVLTTLIIELTLALMYGAGSVLDEEF